MNSPPPLPVAHHHVWRLADSTETMQIFVCRQCGALKKVDNRPMSAAELMRNNRDADT